MPDNSPPRPPLDATATLAAIAYGDLSPTQAAQNSFARIHARENAIGAWAFTSYEAALRAAASADIAPRSQLLRGLPFGVKDVLTTRDMPTGYNSALYTGPDAPLNAPMVDAAAVALLRQAGAVLIGKTATVELASIGAPPRTRNPHNPDHTPGGSSSGSAAAVADGHVQVALGTQTGGSIIRPASFCGTWALKPSWGIVPTEGAKPFAPSLDTIGWFTRSARDLGLILDVFDPRADLEHVSPLNHARIAIWRTAGWSHAEAATQVAMADAIAALKAAGVSITELALPELDGLAAAHQTIMRAEGGRSFLREMEQAPELLHPRIQAMVRDGESAPRDSLRAAHDYAARARAHFDAKSTEFDAVIVPSTLGEAPRGLASTGDLLFNGIFTLLHVPCINMPLWRASNGLPVGLTLTGPRYHDHRILAMAEKIGALFGG